MKSLIVIVSLLVAAVASAEISIVRLSGQNKLFAIPRLPTESAQDAFENYKNYILGHPELASEFTQDELQVISVESEVVTKNLAKKPIALILANRDYDQVEKDRSTYQQRLEFIEKKSPGSQIVILPVAALGRFNLPQKINATEELHGLSSVLYAIGGPDVDPDAYGEENKSSRDTNLMRDLEELFILKYWIDKAKKPVIGICRGHQMVAVALGFKLIQHKDDHGDGKFVDHPIFLLPTKNQLLSQVARSETISVNSYHHQAVDPNAPASAYQKVDVAAIAIDGTIESLEGKNGLIWTFQFHPEFMQNKFSRRIFSGIEKIMSNRSSKRSEAISCNKAGS